MTTSTRARGQMHHRHQGLRRQRPSSARSCGPRRRQPQRRPFGQSSRTLSRSAFGCGRERRRLPPLDNAIGAIDKELAASVKADERAKRLITIPGVDPVIAGSPASGARRLPRTDARARARAEARSGGDASPRWPCMDAPLAQEGFERFGRVIGCGHVSGL
jgi:hypothetical protein